MLSTNKVGFIGGGAMAEALLRGMLGAKLLHAGQCTVSDVVGERLTYLAAKYGVNIASDNQLIAKESDIIFLAIKPQHVDTVLNMAAPCIAQTSLVVSIAAGICLKTLQDHLPRVPIVRVMPNTPVAVGEGMSALALGQFAKPEHGALVAKMFDSVGKTVTVDESLMDAVTGLSGSGPGYAFVLIDALADAGVKVGLNRETAITLSAQTLLGAAKMVLATGEHPAKLRDMVTSPAGTTIAGIHVLEQRGVRAALMDAVVAASQRSRDMGKKDE